MAGATTVDENGVVEEYSADVGSEQKAVTRLVFSCPFGNVVRALLSKV